MVSYLGMADISWRFMIDGRPRRLGRSFLLDIGRSENPQSLKTKTKVGTKIIRRIL